MVANCNKFHFVETGQSCQSILSTYGITIATFFGWNPAVKADCSGLWSSTYACVGVGGSGPTGPSSTTTPPPTSTGGNGIATPTPTQDGMVSNCNKFHFVETGQSCQAILSLYSLSQATFFAWNPATGSTCSGLWANTYACVGVIGGATTTTTTKTSSTTGNGISTPTPTQSGIPSNCNKFHYVQTGQGCQLIADTYSVPLATFYAWNPAVGKDCSGLWANVYVWYVFSVSQVICAC